jgi:hypothetical protein
VLFSDLFDEDPAVRAVRDEVAEDFDGKVNAPGVVQNRPVSIVGKMGFALIQPAMKRGASHSDAT